jgi:hypothetical protein
MTLNLSNVMLQQKADYTLAVHIVPVIETQQEQCEECQLIGAYANARVSYTRDEPLEGPERDVAQMCLACVIPFIDSIDYLNTDIEIDVEVSRVATARPF